MKLEIDNLKKVILKNINNALYLPEIGWLKIKPKKGQPVLGLIHYIYHYEKYN
jgi:hypothetical protein